MPSLLHTQSPALVRALRSLAGHPVFYGLTIRLVIMVALPLLLDDGLLLQGVRYTDIDYDVFTDAADYVASGRSPYERHTYRYTPFLASLLAWPSQFQGGDSGVGVGASTCSASILSLLTWWLDRRYFGRLLFCVADVVCGTIIVSLRRKARKSLDDDTKEELTTILQALQSPQLIDSLWWMYNPLAINICTRGSAESFVVILPVLLTVVLLVGRSGDKATRGSIVGRAIVAGIMHGIAIHSKLYPVIYTVSFMAYISFQEHGQRWKKILQPLPSGKSLFPWTDPGRLVKLIGLWVQRLLLTPSAVLFLVISLSTFGGLTYLAVLGYGRVALEEGFLYHFSRVDHRHNYSMHWYWIYLARGRIAQSLNASVANSSSATSSFAAMAWIGRILLLPQAILLLYVSLGIAPYDLSLALFVQTFLFVAHNKVITAQYFTWYLCLLPLCSGRIQWNSTRMKLSLAYLGVSVVAWLGSAFCLEMQGKPIHLFVWMASVNFFASNVNLLGAILNGYIKTNEVTTEYQDKKNV